MAKEYSGSPKIHMSESKKRRATYIVSMTGLCILFYILGSWQSTTTPTFSSTSNLSEKVACDNNFASSFSSTVSSSSEDDPLDFEAHHKLALDEASMLNKKFPPCGSNLSEYTPCQDIVRARRYPRERLEYQERHCPKIKERIRCTIPAPPRYRIPFKWPQSRDFAWYGNIPHKEGGQDWIQVDGDRFKFPGGGKMFPRGANAYIDDINALIPLTDGKIRTAIDTGCGVGSWGAYLLNRDIIAMSFAPIDSHEAQVQFALERGVPAMIGVMATKRLPYPARAFDIAHCSRCLISWQDFDGMFLMEVDRVLRPGGYWILSGPPIRWKKHYRSWKRSQEDLKKEQDAIEEITKRLCWRKVIEKDELAIWKKPINHKECIESRRIYKTPYICENNNSDAGWYKDMEPCITPLPEVSELDEVAGGEVIGWPKRAFALPPRIKSASIPGLTAENFEEDNEMWRHRVAYYKTIIPLDQGRYRNVMDMNAYLGGFAAALMNFPVWVMNVVPTNSDSDGNTLGVIYERGFIGTYHDWSEAFSTYPRTYDLIHSTRIFSIYQSRIDITYILLEMDRILRPEGSVIIRDTVDVLLKVQAITDKIRWKSKIKDHEIEPLNPEKILIATKMHWTA